ncbi:uncharacterized protein [Populus alba]|uniref:Uncharacterized protein n=1 Tax=Populus alba TaxID=43335 RepID=A0A4U5NN40_POPAL|nr:uncharacterized protein LOC118039738 isoform X3 [Populus alba]XP_034902423.1 uncharacterized protein LOC118039738 isoform X3 [Populus alba]TKR85089.1 uncharacterized protein D5086_0000251170 [Populus alba]
MSDRVLQSYQDRDDIPVKSTKQRQSIWMSHWTRASCRKANEAPKQLGHDPPEVGNGNKYHSLLSGPEMETGSSKFVTGLGEVNKGKRINVMNDNLTMSPKRLRNEMFDGQSSFAMFKPSQDRESVLFLENVVSSGNREGVLKSRIGANSEYDVSLGRNEDHLPSIPAQALPEVEIHERKSQFQAEDLNLVPEQRVKSNSLLERSSRVVSAHVQDDFVRSTSDIVPYEFEVGRSPIQPFFSRLDHINESGSTSLVHEKKMNKNAGLLFRDPSTSNNQLRESFHLMPNRSGFEFLPRQISTRGDSQLEKLYNGSYALPTLPSVHDGETMRIRTTIDSIEEFSRGPPTYTQTTHRFFIKKKTDVNLPDGAQMFRESAISTEIKGKMVTELLAISPDFGFDIKQGVKLLPLDSSTGSEGKESTGNFRTSAVVKENDSLAEGKENTKNASTSAVNEESDSSAETDTMGMDAFCENHLSGVASLQSDKDINEGQKLPASQAGMPSVRQETKGRQMNTELPDINQELTVLPGLARSPDNMETSTSRTQSLDAECFLPHAEHSTNSKSSDCPDTPVRLDPCSRWFKRLKASVSKVEEASSHQKFNQTAELLRNAESYSTDPARKIQEITLSHVWVQRWFHNPSASPKKNPGAVAVSKPESSEAALDFQKKQFPSTAAMALMGKAMNGFCPCEYRKSGSSVVWNTK